MSENNASKKRKTNKNTCDTEALVNTSGEPIRGLLDEIITPPPPPPSGGKYFRGRARISCNMYNRFRARGSSRRNFTRFDPPLLSSAASNPSSIHQFVNALPNLQPRSVLLSSTHVADTDLFCARTLERLGNLNGDVGNSQQQQQQPHTNNTLISKEDVIRNIRLVVRACHPLWASYTNSYSILCLLVSNGLRVNLTVGKLVVTGNVDLVLNNKDHMFRCVVYYEHVKTTVDSSNSMVAKEVASREFLKSLNKECPGSNIPILKVNPSLLIPFGVESFIISLCNKIPFDWKRISSKIEQALEWKDYPASNKTPISYMTNYIIGDKSFIGENVVKQFALLESCRKVYSYFTAESLPRVCYFVGTDCASTMQYDSKLKEIRYDPANDVYVTDEVNPHEMDSFERVWLRNGTMRNNVETIINTRNNRIAQKGRDAHNDDEDLRQQPQDREHCEVS